MSDIKKDKEEQVLPSKEKDASGSTQISSRLNRLKNDTIDAAEKRERLPRKLFWSLFRTELDSIKEARNVDETAKRRQSPLKPEKNPKKVSNLRLVHQQEDKQKEERNDEDS